MSSTSFVSSISKNLSAERDILKNRRFDWNSIGIDLLRIILFARSAKVS